MSECRAFSRMSFSPRQCVQRNISTENHEERKELIVLNDYFVERISKVKTQEDIYIVNTEKLKILKEYEEYKGKINDFVKQKKMDLEYVLENLNSYHKRLEADRKEYLEEKEFTKKRLEEEKEKKNALESDFIRKKQAVDNIIMENVQLILNREDLEDQKEFLKAGFEEEIKELESQIQKEKVTLLSNNQHSLDMNDIINNVKLQYAYMERQSRDNAVLWHKAKLDAMVEKVKQQMEGVEEMKRNKNELERQIESLHKDFKSLESQKEKTKARKETDSNVDNVQIAQLNLILTKFKQELHILIEDIKNLENHKLRLGFEITTYRSLLEGEEQRAGCRQQKLRNAGSVKLPALGPVVSPHSPSSQLVTGGHLEQKMQIQMHMEAHRVVKSYYTED